MIVSPQNTTLTSHYNQLHKRVGIVAEPTVEETISCIKNNAHHADIIELRIDFLGELNPSVVQYLIKNTSKSVIVTCRPTNHGGKYAGSEAFRNELFQAAITSRAEYIDIEYDSPFTPFFSELKKSSGIKTKLILSYHYFTTTPAIKTLTGLYTKLSQLNPDLIKIVPFARSILDNFVVFSLLNYVARKNKKNLVSFCRGERGEISRVLGKKYGSPFTYGSLSEKNILKNNPLLSLTPGLLSLKELEETYNLSMISASTKVFGVIGSHAEYSCSQYLYNPNFREKNLNCVFLPFKVTSEELPQFIANFKDYSWAGASVTLPHKETTINYLDILADDAQKIGAVNTIVLKKNMLKGYNTDGGGACAALQEVTLLHNKKILVLGAGGAAKALMYGLRQSNAKITKITVTNRTYAKALYLAKKYNVASIPLKNLHQLLAHHDIIINTTSVGMFPHPHESLVKEEDFHNTLHDPYDKVVMDIIYTPRITTLLKTAQRVGCTIIPGERMLIHQAVEQCKLLTGTTLSLQDATKYFNYYANLKTPSYDCNPQ